MRCAAILVNYFSASETLIAAASVRSECNDCALIVVDNSACPAELNRLASGLPLATRLIAAPHNLGFAAACNLAYAQTDAEFLLLLNPDARLLPGGFGALIATLEADHRLAAVAPATWWDEHRHWLLPTLLPETAWQWGITALAKRWPGAIGQKVATRWLNWQQHLHAAVSPQVVNYLSGAILLLRRSAIEACGGLFDERFFMFFEDADLSRRLVSAGFTLALDPHAHAIHRWQNRVTKIPLMAQSAAQYRAKHYPRMQRLWPVLARALPIGTGEAGGIALGHFASFDSCDAWMGWLNGAQILCISPSPLGYPAIFRPLGCEPSPASATLWDRLDPGYYTAHITQKGHPTWVGFEKRLP